MFFVPGFMPYICSSALKQFFCLKNAIIYFYEVEDGLLVYKW